MSYIFSFLILLGFSAHSLEINPLQKGAKVPDSSVRTIEGKSVGFLSLIQGKPSLLIFYRGGWCPYCNMHLKDLLKIEKQMTELGYRIYGISPDRPEVLKKSVEKHGMKYELISDSSMELAKKFGLAFEVDSKTLKKYVKYDINLERSSGEKHNLLPVPAVYLVNEKGVITFVHSNPNYKERLSSEKILEVARKNTAKR